MKIEKEETVKIERHALKVKRSFVMLGEIQAPGTFIEVSKDDSTDLCLRGLAEHASPEEISSATTIVGDSNPIESEPPSPSADELIAAYFVRREARA